MPTNGFAIKPLKVELLLGEQKATEFCFQVTWASESGLGLAPRLLDSENRIMNEMGFSYVLWCKV